MGTEQFQPVIVRSKKDSYIFVEGKPNADRFYVLMEGNVRLIREAIGKGAGTVLMPGEMFGLVSAMAGHGYIESAVAMSDVSLLAVERTQYGGLISKANSFAVNSIKSFSQKLRELDVALSERTLKSSSSGDPSHIFQIGEYYEKTGKPAQALYAYRQYLAHCPNADNKKAVVEKVAKLENIVTGKAPVYPLDTMVQSYPKGHLLFAEGESGHTMYIIQAGQVKITKIVDNKEVILAVLNKGDIFGEMAIVEDKPRAATAEVCENCTLLVVNDKNFSTLIKEQPEMVVRIASLMSERIWLLYRQLDNTFIENPLGRIYDALLIQLEKNRVQLNSRESYQFNFGYNELMGMVGLSVIDNKHFDRKIAGDGKVAFKDDKVFVEDISAMQKEAVFYRRAQKISSLGKG